MPVLVSFMQPGFGGSVANLIIGKVRAAESVAVGSATTNAAQDGEIAVLVSTESAAVWGAVGPVPDAGAATASFPLPSGMIVAVEVKAGDKIDFAALA